MSSTGADTSGGTASRRDHKQGNQDRSYTAEQHEAVKRVMRCQATDYYEILKIKKDCTETEVRKSYRRLALTMHPDKNAAPQADEAFKRVSKAFQVLSDADKKRIYDQTGADPEQRGGMPAGASAFGRAAGGSPFAGGGMHGGFDPEDIFSAFFGGNQAFGSPFGGAFGGPFGGGGTQFAFGGAGGPRVYTFNAGNPFAQFGEQARRRAAHQGGEAAGEQPTRMQRFMQFLPLLFIIVPYIFSLIFGGDSSAAAAAPRFKFDREPPYIQLRHTPRFGVNFYVNPLDVQGLSDVKLRRLDREAEAKYVSVLRVNCEHEHHIREEMLRESMGWFVRDQEKYQQALNHPMPHCERLDELGLRLNS